VEEAILFGESDNVVYIKAIGHVTASLCADLKARVFLRMDSKPDIRDIVFDLSDCNYMDSTFMGLLVGFNKRSLRSSERPITLLKVGESCMKLLKTIGILRIVHLSEEDYAVPASLEKLVSTRKATANFLLNAHENLIEISEENEKRFAALRSVLKSQIDPKDGTKED
jgi:anti-anti-sigma factor